MSTGVFSADVVAAVTAHMNGDHAEDCLLICRALGAQPTAGSARMVDVRPGGAAFVAVVDGADVDVVVPWREPVRERAHIRTEVVRMYEEACATLGVSPRGEH